MREKLLSVIVPVYNIKNYIGDCITSILSQSYPALEIIIVDDGSTDGSTDICRELAEKDERILFIYQKNAGVTEARKKGTELAKGEYITFVDGDDYIDTHMYETMMQYASGYDLVTCGIHRQWSLDRYSDVYDDFNDTCTMNEIWARMIYDFEKSKLHPFMPCIYNKIYKRETVLDIFQTMDKEIVYGEDAVFVYQYLLCCNSVKFVKEALYHYRYREDSVWHSVNNKMLENINRAYLSLKKIFDNHSMKESLNNQLEKWIIIMTMRALNQYMGFSKKYRIPQYIIEVQELSQKKVVVYGAGQMGQDVMLQLQWKGIDVVAWVDRDYHYYQQQGLQVQSVDEINEIEYDAIVIAVSSSDLAVTIQENLIALGMDKNKVIWIEPRQLF